NASYAADGYARIRGAAMLATTYGVGELSAINGVMGAKAERSLVFHVVGMPSYQNQRVHKIAHHTLGDGVFGNFVALSAGAAMTVIVIFVAIIVILVVQNLGVVTMAFLGSSKTSVQ